MYPVSYMQVWRTLIVLLRWSKYLDPVFPSPCFMQVAALAAVFSLPSGSVKSLLDFTSPL